MELMKQAHCNTMSVGIFSWSVLEPEEGSMIFFWTPSWTSWSKTAVKPCWPPQRRPAGLAGPNLSEVLRTRYDGIKKSVWRPPQPLLHLAHLPGKDSKDQPDAGAAV